MNNKSKILLCIIITIILLICFLYWYLTNNKQEEKKQEIIKQEEIKQQEEQKKIKYSPIIEDNYNDGSAPIPITGNQMDTPNYLDYHPINVKNKEQPSLKIKFESTLNDKITDDVYYEDASTEEYIDLVIKYSTTVQPAKPYSLVIY